MMTRPAAARIDAGYAGVIKASRRQAFWPIGIIVAILVYLTYAFFAFDMPRLLGSSRLDRGVLLATDSFAHKVHITKSVRSGKLTISVEGQRDAVYETPPDWIDVSGDVVDADLGEGYRVIIDGHEVTFQAPDTPPILVTVGDEEITATTAGPLPAWASANPRKFEARPTLFRRILITRARIQVHRYFLGWEHFLFPFSSPFHGKSAGELFDLATKADRLDPAHSNLAYMARQFWYNPEWQHGEVLIALLETVVMAFLGTAVASMVGLPLAFLAAANFNPFMVTRMAVRRLFDFVRGIDMLVWSLIFIRAFGLGPLTGIMAIAFTDTGTLGKLFSEAIENIDNREVEGVRSTGANAVQRYRFGVIPQILPVFISQSLYYLESNTRSATVIGALGAGGIGLKLVESLQTHSDWENTLYIIILTLVVVILMDMFSGWLRRRLIVSS
jgi:phosphonate transport system permease protein